MRKGHEDSQYLVGWFWQVKSNKEKSMAAVDQTLDLKDEIFDSILSMSDLAGHCTALEPGQRPGMGHAVNVLASLVEKWKHDDTVEYCGIDYSLPLNQMVKDWQDAEGSSYNMDLEDSKGSIPTSLRDLLSRLLHPMGGRMCIGGVDPADSDRDDRANLPSPKPPSPATLSYLDQFSPVLNLNSA